MSWNNLVKCNYSFNVSTWSWKLKATERGAWNQANLILRLHARTQEAEPCVTSRDSRDSWLVGISTAKTHLRPSWEPISDTCVAKSIAAGYGASDETSLDPSEPCRFDQRSDCAIIRPATDLAASGKTTAPTNCKCRVAATTICSWPALLAVQPLNKASQKCLCLHGHGRRFKCRSVQSNIDLPIRQSMSKATSELFNISSRRVSQDQYRYVHGSSAVIVTCVTSWQLETNES